MVKVPGTALVTIDERGPFRALLEQAHRMYIDGYSEHAVLASRTWVLVSAGAGDVSTTRYLRYIEGIALQDLGRHREAMTVAMDLLRDLEDEPDLTWRAKGLALLAECSSQVKEVSRAMDALAEGAWLVARTRPGPYRHLSASIAVALALRAAYLFEQADELMAGIQLGDDVEVDLLVLQERALLSAFWGTTLLVVGHRDAAGPHLVATAERSLRMGRMAVLADDSEMAARAEVIEAYALSQLGFVELAAARARAASRRFRLRAELIETHLVRLVLGRAAMQAGDYDEAREHLRSAWDSSTGANLDIWKAAAKEAMADVEVAEHGRHPAVGMWKQLAREALGQVWIERDGRFTALQTRNQVRALTEQSDRMGQAALLDHLTGLGNRRMMAGVVERAGADLSVVFVDVDQFKLVNDHYSHAVGDQVLRRIAILLRAHCRTDDVLVRYGGDEFIVLVFGGDTAAEGVAERLHHAVRAAPWGQIAPGLAITVSVGVGRRAPAHGAIAAADAALYAAKRAGRDRVVTV